MTGDTMEGPGPRDDADPAELEVLRRLLDTAPEALMDEFARVDIDWGLHGSD